jgi:Tfp pilus assembly protein PilN
MIKINLASKKQSVVATGAAPEAGGRGGRMGTLFNSVDPGQLGDALRDLPLRQKILPSVGLCVALIYISSTWQGQKIAEQEKELAQLEERQMRLKGDFGKTRGYDQLKKTLDEDERMIRTKIETIQKLIADRQTPPKLLLTLSSTIPEEVWINEVKIEKGLVRLKGNSFGYNQVSDYMKNLSESAYFTDLTLVGTKVVKDETGASNPAFEISAKRR